MFSNNESIRTNPDINHQGWWRFYSFQSMKGWLTGQSELRHTEVKCSVQMQLTLLPNRCINFRLETSKVFKFPQGVSIMAKAKRPPRVRRF